MSRINLEPYNKIYGKDLGKPGRFQVKLSVHFLTNKLQIKTEICSVLEQIFIIAESNPVVVQCVMWKLRVSQI